MAWDEVHAEAVVALKPVQHDLVQEACLQEDLGMELNGEAMRGTPR